MAEATERLNIVITAQDQASAVVKNVGTEVSGMFSKLATGAAAGAGFAIFNQVGQAISQAFQGATDAIIGFNSTLEQSRLGWTTMLGGAAQAESMLKQLQDFAQATPFSFPEVEQAARRFAAMGIAAGDIIPLIRSVSEAAIAVGGGADAINRISLALGQMSTRTKVTSQDMMQLTEVGIPAWRILAEATGTSVAQIQDAVEKGQVSSDVMIRAFQRFADVHWKDLLDTQTFQTAMSNIGDASQRLIAGAFQPLFKGLEDLAIRFSQFLGSPDVQNFANGVANAQLAIAQFIQTISQSGPTLLVFQGALAGIATVLGVQIVGAAGAATAALAPLVGAFIVANAPLVALATVAAAAGVIIATNWQSIVEATSGLVQGVGELLGQLLGWLSGTFLPNFTQSWSQSWSDLADVSLSALNAVGEAWAQFWGGEIGPSGQSAFQTLQDVAAAGWGGFVDIATGALRAVLTAWNTFISAVSALHEHGIDIPGMEDLVGNFADVDAIASNFSDTMRHQVPQAVGAAFSSVGTFFHDTLPAAIGHTVETVAAAGGDVSQAVRDLFANLTKQAPNLATNMFDFGKGAGSAFGNGLVQGTKPLLEELARLIAQAFAAPAQNALADTDKLIERARLVIADLSQAPEDRAAALRQMLELQLRVRPRQALEAFDASEGVRQAQLVEDAASRARRIAEITQQLSGGVAGAATGLAPGAIATTGPTALVAPAAPPPTIVDLRIAVSTDGGAQQVFEELIEANGQAQMPPVIEVSAVRRN